MARTGRVPLEASRSSARGTARGPQRLDRSARSWMFEVACALALILGITGALRLAWLCDDAYISFRYADNLVHGLGLVDVRSSLRPRPDPRHHRRPPARVAL